MPIERIPLPARDRGYWLALRQRDITASDVGVVCGVANWGSQAELYAEKKGLRGPIPDNPSMRRGRWEEPACFEALAETYPEWEVRRAKIYLRDPDLRLGCTPDGYATAPDRPGIGVVQAKSVDRWEFRRRWMIDPDDSPIHGDVVIPPDYVLQTLTEEILSEADWGVLAVIIGSNQFRLFEIERDAEMEDMIKTNVARFWADYLDANIMPPFDPQRDAELVKRLFPHDTGTTVDLSLDNRALPLVEDLIETREALKRMKKKEEELKTELQGKIGENTYATLADGRCLSWRKFFRRSHVVPAYDYRQLRILKRQPERFKEEEEDE